MMLVVMSAMLFVWTPQSSAASVLQSAADQQEIAVEAFQVLDLPLNVINVTVTHPEKGGLLRCSLSNSSDRQILGLRYLLYLVDTNNKIRAIVDRSEGVRLAAYASKTVTFRTPLKMKVKSGYRLELILEQVVGDLSVWEVLKAREALETYLSGDYSVMPQVLRVANSIDAPPRVSVIY